MVGRAMTDRRFVWAGAIAAIFIIITLEAHSREVKGRQSARQQQADWHGAVIKLAIPVTRQIDGERRHLTEDCTGTIIQAAPVKILTAWHCFDGMDDLSRPGRARITGKWYPTRLTEHGASMARDWALLELPSNSPTDLVSIDVDTGEGTLASGTALTMAGFSGDQALGELGQVLTWDSDCTLIAYVERRGQTDCRAFKGASGGPVLLARGGGWVVIGVISAKSAAGMTLFTPASQFRSFLR